MSKDNYKDDYRNSNKPEIKVNRILQIQRENPNMIYAGVRIDELFDPDGSVLEQYLNNNWEFVVDDSIIDNDYDSTKSRDTEANYKPTPLTRNGKGGAKFVFVCKSKEQFKIDEQKRVAKDQQRFVDSTVGRTIEKKGTNLKITDPEVNIKNAKQGE